MDHITLNKISNYQPWGRSPEIQYGVSDLNTFLGKTEVDDETISLITILESSGLTFALWCLGLLPDYDLRVMEFKLKCARRVEHIDKTGWSKKHLDVLEKFIESEVSKEELSSIERTAFSEASFESRRNINVSVRKVPDFCDPDIIRSEIVETLSIYSHTALVDAKYAVAHAISKKAEDVSYTVIHVNKALSREATKSLKFPISAFRASIRYAQLAEDTESEYQIKLFKEIFG